MESSISVDLASRWTQSPEVLFREVDGEAVLLDLKTEQYHGLNSVGTRIWKLLAEDGALSTVYARLMDEYDVDGARLQADLLKLVEELAQRGMVIPEEKR
jgi:hypothetical protein